MAGLLIPKQREALPRRTSDSGFGRELSRTDSQPYLNLPMKLLLLPLSLILALYVFANSQNRPNILFIMSDNHAAHAISVRECLTTKASRRRSSPWRTSGSFFGLKAFRESPTLTSVSGSRKSFRRSPGEKEMIRGHQVKGLLR